MNNQTSSFIDVKVVTWLRDSHGLFDYESKNISLKKSKVSATANIYSEDGNIVVQNIDKAQPIEGEDKSAMDYLFSLQSDKNRRDKFSIVSDKAYTTGNSSNNAFLVVRSLKVDHKTQKGYELEAGDVIRFGRMEYRVLEYRDNDSQTFSVITNSTPLNDCPFNVAAKSCSAEGSIRKQCRICLMDDQDSEEAFINPCSCKGTSEYVHITCLQNWINVKTKQRVGPDVSCTYWKKLNCEVCKVSLPDVINLGGETLELIPYVRPENPYIILERLYHNEAKENAADSKMVILLGLSNLDSQIKLGRGHECDIRENDISVSRFHAYMKFQNGKFVLFDNNSKFGTLVLLRRNYQVDRRKVALQIGRTVVAFSFRATEPLVNGKPGKQVLPLERASKKLIVDENEEFSD